MTIQDALQRLDRLEGYLREDPDNMSLMTEAFEASLQAGAWERGEFHLRHAQALHREDILWQLRESHWLLAQHRFTEAEELLRRVAESEQTPDALRPVVAHDLAYAALRRGDFSAGIDSLAPWLQGIDASQPLDADMQVLWLRLLHRAEEFDTAMAWSRTRWQTRQLAAPAAGVAALVALDAEDLAACLTWSDHALQAPDAPLEALVARGSAALAHQDTVTARTLLQAALEQLPQDGRAWSALAFTDLLEHQPEAARASFAHALKYMPEHVGTWHGLGWTCLLQGDLDAALQAFQTALDLDRNFGESHGGLGVVKALRGEREAAEAAIERALRLDKNNLSARYAQAVLSGETRDTEAVRRLAMRLLGTRRGPLGGSLLDMIPALAQAPEQGADNTTDDELPRPASN